MLTKIPLEMNSIAEITEHWIENRKRVLDVFYKLNDQDFQAKPDQGKWSFSEVGEHLYLTQWNIVRTIPIVISGKLGFETDHQPNLDYAFILKSTARPTGFKNPENVSPLNNYSKDQVLQLLKKSEDKMISNTNNLPKEKLISRGLEHPAFGLLNLFNFLWVMSLHEGLHAVALEEKFEKLRGTND